VDLIAASRRASKPAQANRRRAIATAFVSSVLARVAAPRLDARPAYPEELYELARAALFALGSREAAGAGQWRR
jgi:hypothetical protein